MTVTNPPATTTPAAFKTWATSVATDVNAATADIAALEDGYTATGEQVAPDFKATGKTGATTSPGILAGGTNTGAAPTTGAHVVGELVIGHDGKLYTCTAAGTPGTWVLASGGVGPETPVQGATTVEGQIVGLTTGNGYLLGSGDDPADVEAFNVPLVQISPNGVYIQGDAAAVSLISADGSFAYLSFQGNMVTASASGLSLEVDTGDKIRLFGNASTGIDGTDTVADATDNASAILRLNELLAVLRDLGVLA